MKISNGKKQLAKIIHENGGWRDGAEWAAQDKDGEVFGFCHKPKMGLSREVWGGEGCTGPWATRVNAVRNWHQTILSRDEYFHLYPAPDTDGWIEWNGGECPVAEGTPISVRHRGGEEFAEAFALGCWNSRWAHEGTAGDVVAYRLRYQSAEPVPEPVVEAKPTIEQLAADYRNRKDYAYRKQQEAYAAKADADEALRKLELAGEEIGLIVTLITAK